MSALLEIDGLETSYGSSQVLFGVSLSVAESEVATLLGRNGMGKTTTVRSICGLEKPGGGSIRFAGQRKARPEAPAQSLRLLSGEVGALSSALYDPGETVSPLRSGLGSLSRIARAMSSEP